MRIDERHAESGVDGAEQRPLEAGRLARAGLPDDVNRTEQVVREDTERRPGGLRVVGREGDGWVLLHKRKVFGDGRRPLPPRTIPRATAREWCADAATVEHASIRPDQGAAEDAGREGTVPIVRSSCRAPRHER